MSSQGDLPITGVPPLAQARRRAGQVLWIEQLWPAMLPALAVVLLLMLVSLLTLPQRLPGWLHAALLVMVLGGVALQLRRRLSELSPPPPRACDERIERASRLPHRPLSTLSDRPALDTAMGSAGSLLWQAHLQRTSAGLNRLVAGPPRLAVREHDRFGIALPLLAALALALLLSGRQAPLRIASGFWPGFEMPLGPVPSLQAWITPPDYAGGAPIFLTDPHGHYDVAAGARLTVSLTGTSARPTLAAREASGASFSQLSAQSWTAERILSASLHVSVRGAGYRLADWSIDVQPSLAPVARWTAPPGPASTEPWHTRLPWAVTHRYGVRSLAAEIRLVSSHGPARVLRVPIPLSGTPTQAGGVALPDLSADPWAGEAVTARLLATDVTGRTGTSAEARFTLPSRPFRNPLARAVLDVRRRLALGREPAAAAADDLQALGDTPGEFAQDSSLFLNLSTTASLLRLPDTATRIGEASGRLWELALALEDGLHNDRAGARAALDVRAAQDRLSAQLEHMRQLGDKGQSEAEQTELRARIDAMSAAIAQRMQALAAQAAREHTTLPAMPDQSMLSGQDLARMLQKMRDAAAGGHADEAERQLSQMQAMLDHMRAATPRDLAEAKQQAAARQQAQEQMAAVQDLVQRQSALLDHAQSRKTASDRAQATAPSDTTGDGEDASQGGAVDGSGMDPATRALMQQLGIRLQPGQPDPGTPAGQQAAGHGAGSPPPGSPQPATAADQQAAQQADRHAQRVLRRALDELATEFKSLTGKSADSFETATRAMDRARDALAAQQDGPAADAQIQALAALQKGAQQMRSAMSGSGGGSGAGGGMALLPGDAGTGDQPGGEEEDADQSGGRDPLGRHLASGHAGMDDGDETHVPEHGEPARSREIEQELRRRDSDRTRPQQELDYLDRLLKSF